MGGSVFGLALLEFPLGSLIFKSRSSVTVIVYVSPLYAQLMNPTGKVGRALNFNLKLEREQGDDDGVAPKLNVLSNANRMLGLFKEGIRQLRRWKSTNGLVTRAPGKSRKRSISCDQTPRGGQEFLVCQFHQVLIGNIYRSKVRREDAIHHFGTALGIAIPPVGNTNCFGVITTSPSFFSMEAILTMLTLTFNEPNHTEAEDCITRAEVLQL